MERVTYQGRTLNTRTVDMFEAIEYLTGLELRITQGSYNTSVSASAGTHAGGGAIDIGAAELTPAQRKAVVLAGRQVGFAMWLRTPAQSDWPYHVHGIAMNDGDLSDAAREQVRDYIAGRNGLANNGPDDGPRGYEHTTWEDWAAAHPDWRGLTVGQVEEIKDFVKAELLALEKRIYAGPRYAALQNSANTLIAEMRAHDGEEDARYGYYADKLYEILTTAKADDGDAAAITALSEKVDKMTQLLETLVVTPAPKA